jgi:DnaK suppressor protein
MASTATKGLTKAQIGKFRQQLEGKGNEIRASLETSRAGKALIGEQAQSLEDLPVQAHEEWIFLNRNSIDVSLLREVEEALERVEEGLYGECMDCDEPISTKRLEAIPWARYCISCQEELAAMEAESRLTENKPRF